MVGNNEYLKYLMMVEELQNQNNQRNGEMGLADEGKGDVEGWVILQIRQTNQPENKNSA